MQRQEMNFWQIVKRRAHKHQQKKKTYKKLNDNASLRLKEQQ